MSMSIPAAAEEDANPDANLNLTTAENLHQDSDEVVDDSNTQTTKDALPELTDSAILSMKSLQRYSRDQLLQLRQAPLSQKRPEFLDVAFNNANGIWDPELWHRSRSDTPNENGVRNEQPELHKRRSGDPRERIRKEQDGIILSPQRRSFNSGCYVPFKENQRANRPHSPLGKSENSHINHRELPPGARRIGSGRILSREVPWDFQEKSEIDNDYGYRKERSRDIDRDDRFERRTFTRDFDVNREKEKHVGRNNGRYNDRRRISNENRDEEPEWFSGGPVSQNETIELRGFEDADDKIGKKKLSSSQKRKLKERSVKNSEALQHPEMKEKQDENAVEKHNQNSQEGAAPNRKSPVPEKNNGGGDTQEKHKSAGEDVGNENNAFNIDDILKCDTIAELLSNGVGGEDGDNTGSRFSQWFKRESPIKQQLLDSRRSSLQDDHLFRSLLNDISEPNVIPANSDLYFTPISPAANTANNLNMRQGNTSSIQKPINIFDMFQRNKQQNEDSFNSKNHDISPSKLLSLEELEARMMHQGGGDPGAARAMAAQNKQMSQKPEGDSVAFKRLLAQAVTSNNAHMQSKPQQSMSILEMLKHSQQDDASRLVSQMMGPTSPNPMSSSTNDIAFKLQQVKNQVQAQQIQQNQIDMLKLMNNNAQRQQMGLSPLPEMGLSQSRELLSRPEAQAILRAMHQRIPSPRELQVHTQNIMQRALIKKKLEEQQENYKKRQEMQQRGSSPTRGLSPVKHTSSPTPLAFTPTSVLRKMTAEKDDLSKEMSKMSELQGKLPQGRPVMGIKSSLQAQAQQWNPQQLKQPVGRPIVKANASLQTNQNQQQQQDQQQFYQQQQQQRLYGQQQQQQQHQSRKIGSQFANHSQSGASSQQTSLSHHSYQQPFVTQQFQQQLTHQLRAQHQQHQPPQQKSQFGNQQNHPSLHWSQQHQVLLGHNYDARGVGERGGASNNGGDLSPTSNQLARWFSPELLERARAGKVPNLPSATAAQHAISLEEIERQTAPPVHN